MNNTQRPQNVPEGFEQIIIKLPDGRTAMVWAQTTESFVDGRTRISMEIIPDSLVIVGEGED